MSPGGGSELLHFRSGLESRKVWRSQPEAGSRPREARVVAESYLEQIIRDRVPPLTSFTNTAECGIFVSNKYQRRTFTMQRRMWTVTIVFCLLFLPFSLAYAQSFEVYNLNLLVKQGEVLVVRVAPDLVGKNLGLYVFGGDYPVDEKGFVFVGVDINQKPARYIAYLVEYQENQKPRQYDFYYRHIDVVETVFGEPWYAGPIRPRSEAVKKQRTREQAIKDKAYKSANFFENFTTGRFEYPLSEIEVTDKFGTPRLYGSRDRKTKKIKIQQTINHAGTDLRAKNPQPVMAINSGRVLLAHNFPLRGTEGNMLIIDHGSGVISLYLHLSKFKVKVGDVVKKGQVVALTGATPRGASPHLHFMIKVHGVNVDPLAFIDTINTALPYGEKQ